MILLIPGEMLANFIWRRQLRASCNGVFISKNIEIEPSMQKVRLINAFNVVEIRKLINREVPK